MRTESLIVRYVARRTVPFIQLFALYVLGHGEDGPGGGFQGGVIFAASWVLLALAYGWPFGRHQIRQGTADVLAPTGALIYSGIGAACLLMGGAFLDYRALAGGNHEAEHLANHLGLIGIEAGVMITVTSAMAILFFEMAKPKRVQDRQDDLYARQLEAEGSPEVTWTTETDSADAGEERS